MRINFRFLFFCILSFVFLGCSNKPENTEDPVLESYRLIDNQRTDEAIDLLETHLANDQKNNTYRSVLASAYAHKAGIRIQKLVPAISESEKLKKLSEALPKVKADESNAKRTNADTLNVVAWLSNLSDVFHAYSAIPVVETENLVYLRHSIYILNEIGTDIKPEDALYRAVLEVILFKNILAGTFKGGLVDSAKIDTAACLVDIGSFNDTFVELGKILIDIYGDIGIAFPKQAASMNDQANRVKETVSKIAESAKVVSGLDELAKLTVKQAAKDRGLEKIIKCEN